MQRLQAELADHVARTREDAESAERLRQQVGFMAERWFWVFLSSRHRPPYLAQPLPSPPPLQVRDYRARFETEITEHARDVGALREAEATLDESRATVLRLQVWMQKCGHVGTLCEAAGV